MENFNFHVPAEVYATLGRRSQRAPVTYKRFNSSAEALRYAVETLTADQLHGTIMEVSDVRFDAAAIRALYLSTQYPLPRAKST
jgi:hypothetical protein